jgi:hypothetical protein
MGLLQVIPMLWPAIICRFSIDASSVLEQDTAKVVKNECHHEPLQPHLCNRNEEAARQEAICYPFNCTLIARHRRFTATLTKLRISLLITLTLLTGLYQVAAQSFVLTSSPGVGSTPVCVIAADINGDAKVDLISANLNGGTLTVLTNNGNGSFTFSATLEVGSEPFSVAAADINGDGRVDLVCANFGDNTLTVLTNNGNGVFGSNATYNVGNAPQSVVAADVNGDGKVDLICANWADNTLTVLTNDGKGKFTVSSTNAVGGSPAFVAAADLNGDGNVDLISANCFAGTLTILTNNGLGVFGSNAIYTVGGSPVCLAVADVNGDGKPDLISANSYINTLSVLTNAGNGRFVLASTLSTGVDFWPQSVVAADINGDGKEDIIFVNFNDFGIPGTLTVLTNNGTGEFTNSFSFEVGEGPYCVVASDVNGDGKLDLITANHMDDTLSVLIAVPTLAINSSGRDVLVSWPSAWTNWTLQQNSNLAMTNWSASTGIADDRTNKSITVTSPTDNLFFRLSNP